MMTDSKRTRYTLFSTLIAPHLDSACTLAGWMVGSDSVEDVVRDACFRAMRCLMEEDSETDESNGRVLLLSFVHQSGRAWVRRQDFAAGRYLNSGDSSLAEADSKLSGWGVSSDVSLHRDDALHRIRDCSEAEINKWLMGLPLACRVAMVLRDIEGLRYDQIAQVVGITPDQVTPRLAEAQRLLHRAWMVDQFAENERRDDL
ncbi:putative RNA polymerase sigma factor [Azospirillaceae bacterium]